MEHAGFFAVISVRLAAAARQFLPWAAGFAGRHKKGPARGEGEAFGSSAEADDRQSAAREEDGRNLFDRTYAAASRVRQSPDGQFSYAFWEAAKKKAPSRRWSLMKVGQTDEGGGNAVCLWALPREEDSAQTRVAKRVDRGRRCSRASQRHSEYADAKLFLQWKGLHHSHASRAGKVSLFDPIMALPLHSSRRQRADIEQKSLSVIKSLRGVPQCKRPRPRGGQGLIEGGNPPARKRRERGGRRLATSSAV